MMWVLLFFLSVWILFKPRRSKHKIKEQRREGYENRTHSHNIDDSEHYQRSIYDRDITTLSQYYENPKMSCPYKYEKAQDVLKTLHSDPNNQYYGFTGTNFKYNDDRHVKWDKLSQPLPIHSDFFRS